MTFKKLKRTGIGALAVACAMVCVFVGCRKDEPKPAPQVDPASPASYMKDAAFRAQLKAQREVSKSCLRTRNEIASKMAEQIDAMKAKLKTDDAARAEAALADDPAWKDLKKQYQEAEAAFEANRKKTLSIVRERLTQKKQTPVSK